MHLPTLSEAEALLDEAASQNPGPWVAHSRYAAQAARLIAAQAAPLVAESAYICGLLHDIGRRNGPSDMRHILDGYHFLQTLGFSDAARISLTHSFPIQEALSGSGKWDCSPEELRFVQEKLAGIEYDDYDRLIQLCDALALPSGFCLIEKRFVDVSLRHGFNEYTLAKWQAWLGLLQRFSAATGGPLYRLLPGIVENTFGL